MLLNKLWYNVIGYNVVKIEGLSVEKLLNIAANSGIVLRQLKPKEQYITVMVLKPDIEKMRKVLPQGAYIMTLVKKGGLPILYEERKDRLVLLAGLIFVVLGLYAATSFVWKVDIHGSDAASRLKVYELLKNEGVKKGTLNYRLDEVYLENQILLKMPRFIWTDVDKQGAVIKVKLIEAEKIPEIVDRVTPADVVAKKSGIVEEVLVLQGSALVKTGQEVKAGDVLISSVIGKEDKTSVVRAIGSVTARVQYTTQVSAPAMETVRQRTGKTAVDKYLWIAGMKVCYSKGMQFTVCDKEIRQQYFSGAVSPVYIETVTRYEVKEIKKELSENEVIAKLERLAYNKIKHLLPEQGELLARRLELQKKKDIMTATLVIDMAEDIAEFRPVQ